MTVRLSSQDQQAQLRAAQLREVLRRQAADEAASKEASSQLRSRITRNRLTAAGNDGVERASGWRALEARSQPSGAHSGSGRAGGAQPQASQTALPKMLWNEHMVNDVVSAAIEQGTVTAEENHGYLQSAKEALGTEGSSATLSQEEVVAFLTRNGIDLGRADPAQLEAATRFVNAAGTPEERQQRLGKTAASLSALSRGGLPQLPRQEMLDLMWGAAEVPGHAFERLSDAELAAKFDQIAGALLKPGQHEVEIDRHRLKVTVDSQLEVLSTETAKRSFWSRAGSVLKKVGEYAMVAASFVPGPIGIAARVANMVVSAVKAARSKSVLGMIGAAAGGVAGFASAIAGKAVEGVASATARVVTTVQRGAQAVQSGIQAYRSRNPAALLGAVAAGAGVIAGVVEKSAAGLANVMNQVKDWASAGRTGLQTVDAVERGDALGAIAGGLSAASQTTGLLGKEDLSETLGQYAEYPATASRVEQAIRQDDFFLAASRVSGFAAAELFDGGTREELERLSRTFERTGKMVDAGQRGDYLELLEIGSRVANDYADNADVAVAERVLSAGADLQDALEAGEPWGIGRAAETMVITVKEAAEELQVRYFPPEVPLTTRQWDPSQLTPQVAVPTAATAAASATLGSPVIDIDLSRAASGAVGGVEGPEATIQAQPPVIARGAAVESPDVESADDFATQRWHTRVGDLVARVQRMSEGVYRAAFGEGQNMLADTISLMPSVLTGSAGRAEELYRRMSEASSEGRRLMAEGASVEELEAVSRSLEGMIAEGNELLDDKDWEFGFGLGVASTVETTADLMIDALGPAWLKTAYHSIKGAGVRMAEAESLDQTTALHAAVTGASIGLGREVASRLTGGMTDGIVKEALDEASKQVGKAIPSVHEKLLGIKATDMEDWDRQAAEIIADEVFDRSMNVALDSVFDNVFRDLGKSELKDFGATVGLEEVKKSFEPILRQSIEKVVKAGLNGAWDEMRSFVLSMHQVRGVS